MTDDDLEAQLRRSLKREAAKVHPSDRLESILAESAGARSRNKRRWLAVAGAVAATAAIVCGSILASNNQKVEHWAPPPAPSSPAPPPSSPAPSTPATSSPTPSPSEPSPSGSTPASSSNPPTSPPDDESSERSEVRVYQVVGNGGEGDQGRLTLTRRDWISPVSGSASEVEQVRAAVDYALANTTSWSGATVRSVTRSGQSITVDFEEPPPNSRGSELEVGLYAIVWTVQSILASGDVPVTVTGAGQPYPGGTRLTRASMPSELLASIWVDGAFDFPISSAQKSTITGSVQLYEAALKWRLVRNDNTTVASSTVLRAVVSEQRVRFSFTVKPQPPGKYTLRLEGTSHEDGSVIGTLTVPYHVEK